MDRLHHDGRAGADPGRFRPQPAPRPIDERVVELAIRRLRQRIKGAE